MTSVPTVSVIVAFLFLFISANAVAKSKFVKILDEDNWESMLNGEWMVEFYAPWCPACRALEPVWEDFATWSDDLEITVGKVDVTTSPGLSGRFMVTALPTIYHIKNGVFRQYRGARDRNELISFIEEKRWQAAEAIPNWKAPSSVQMSVVSSFFKLSMLLRNIHTSLTEEHGIPYWGSYLLFALATIVIGAVLGLVLVFMIDCFYPSRVSQKKTEPDGDQDGSPAQQDDDDVEDIVDEEGSDSDDLEPENEEVDEGVVEAEDDQAVDADDGQAAETEKGDTEEAEKTTENVDGAAPSSSPDVRRRRARKAD